MGTALKSDGGVQADELGAATINFPAISAGTFGFPADTAADVALRAVRDYLPGETGIHGAAFVLRRGTKTLFERRSVGLRWSLHGDNRKPSVLPSRTTGERRAGKVIEGRGGSAGLSLLQPSLAALVGLRDAWSLDTLHDEDVQVVRPSKDTRGDDGWLLSPNGSGPKVINGSDDPLGRKIDGVVHDTVDVPVVELRFVGATPSGWVHATDVPARTLSPTGKGDGAG